MSLRKYTLIASRVSYAGTYVDGVWTESVALPFTFLASVQPMSERQMQALPEGRRSKGGFVLFTATKLQTVLGGKSPDLVTINDKRYIVEKSEPWQNTNLAHYKVLVVEE